MAQDLRIPCMTLHVHCLVSATLPWMNTIAHLVISILFPGPPFTSPMLEVSIRQIRKNCVLLHLLGGPWSCKGGWEEVRQALQNILLNAWSINHKTSSRSLMRGSEGLWHLWQTQWYLHYNRPLINERSWATIHKQRKYQPHLTCFADDFNFPS